ncbi:hypothetical protein CAPTEDRAFT_175120 [Capitella teleta]|uniref:G-protein coupled receptors family 1 profile domain-containing protein n=1 Tax=Capitella teleta TaxID=283909 RepID=R7UEM0_CAPTE|nr:hypothetical protein CAPTEDRAFT_175120 [Capitella teleta]|eukprot:ELU01722.1 hypothetical protein CAPTEDRAFT_175120 [Capitella teleta]
MMQAIFVMMPSLVYVMLDGCWRPKQICFALQGAETMLLAATMAHICLAVCDCHTALLRPLQYQLRQVSAYSTLNIVITWLFAAIMSMPFLVVSGVMPTQEAQEQCTPHACTLMRPEHALAKTGGVLLLPSAILLGLYTCAHRAIVKQQSVITKMQAEVNSGTTSNGDVTGLDHLEHDIASEKTITQTIDICCQLAGVSPISRALTTPDITACPEEIATDSNAPRNEEEEQEKYDRCKQCNGDAQAAGDEQSESHQRSNSIKCIAQVHLHQRQGKRMTLRVHRQRSVLRLALLMVCAFLVLVLPNCLAQVVTSVCASCDTSAALSIALQWLSHSSCLINPIIYILATKDFQQSFKELCPC